MRAPTCPCWRHAWPCAVALALLAASGGALAQGVKVGTLRIASVPAGASVELVGGAAGVTPLAVSERDIYPNHYSDARADMYGMVLLRHPGCAPLRHRVTLGDIEQGLQLRLACDTAAAGPLEAPPELSPAALPAAQSFTAAPRPGATLPQRRLRQLQVLQELLDDGLIGPDEEQRIRRRILQAGSSGD
ncbi:MAG TPA: hypothetical protein VFY97_01485 [Rhodanobacteraceae bacterium]|nr:hypothetical protein [Rhodanobacteraceae bacterium]